MLGGENRRSKVYTSCLEVLRKLGTCSVWVWGLKDKNPLRWCIPGSKTTNKLQRRYFEVKKREATYDSQLSSLKRNKYCTRDVFREWNKWSKGWLIYLDFLKHERKCGWRSCMLTYRKKVQGTIFEVKSQLKIYTWGIFRLNVPTNGVVDTFRS